MRRWTSKADFYCEAHRRSLWAGNQLNWHTLPEFECLPRTLRDGSLWGTRVLAASDPDAVRYNLTGKQALRWASQLAKRYPADAVTVWAMAPDDRLTLQGEVTTSHTGLVLMYNTRRGANLREAMRHPEMACGLQAEMLIRGRLDDPAQDYVRTVLEQWPDAVVEFTAYDHRLGYLRWNTIIWEVRRY